MAQIRIITGLGYGLVTFLFIKNSENIGEYLSEMTRASMHFWSRAPKDRLADNDNGGSTKELGALSDKIDKLAMLKRETVHVHHGSNSTTGWVTTIIGGTVVAVIVVHFTGLFDMSGIMYVTQAKFKTATEALKEGVNAVGAALSKVRTEVLDRIGLLEKNLEEVTSELKDQISSSTDAVRDDVSKVSSSVKEVGGLVNGLESKLGTIEGGVGDLRTALDKANRGIHLLIHVVADSYRYGTSGKRNDKLYSDLLSFENAAPAVADADADQSLKQLKDNAEQGPVMKLMSQVIRPGSADNGGGGAVPSVAEKITRQLSMTGL